MSALDKNSSPSHGVYIYIFLRNSYANIIFVVSHCVCVCVCGRPQDYIMDRDPQGGEVDFRNSHSHFTYYYYHTSTTDNSSTW